MIPAIATPKLTSKLTPKSQSTEEGKKFDGDKVRFDLMSPEFEKEVAECLTYGANKYGPNNWQNVEDAQNRYYAALRRHINAWRSGEKVDAESGLSHLAHAACNIMFLMYFEGENK